MQTLANLLKPVACLEYVYDYICRRFSFMTSTTSNIASVPTGFFTYDAGGVIGESAETTTGALKAELVDLQEETAPFHAAGKPFSAEHNPSITAHITITATTDMLHYGYRYYSPGLGRWMNRDPIGEDGGLNVYSFCVNTPNTHVDPNGLFIFGCKRRSDKCCCCCVDDLKIEPSSLKSEFTPWKSPQWWEFWYEGSPGGYKVPFDIVADLSYKEISKDIQNTACKIKWIETWHKGKPWYAPFATQGQSFDISKNFQGKFNNHTCCGQSKVVKIPDSPGWGSVRQNTSGTMHLKIEVTVNSGTDSECTTICSYSEKKVVVEIKMKMTNGQPDYGYESFQVIKK